MRITWEPTRVGPELGIKFAVDARTCNSQGLYQVAGGLTRTGAPCRVWLKMEENTGARAAAKRAREIIIVTYIKAGISTVRQRGADSMAGRSSQEARHVYGGVGRTEPEPSRADPIARKKGEDAVELKKER